MKRLLVSLVLVACTLSGCVTDNTTYILACKPYADETRQVMVPEGQTIVRGYVEVFDNYALLTDEYNRTTAIPARCELSAVDW
jgi:hypothetical protein